MLAVSGTLAAKQEPLQAPVVTQDGQVYEPGHGVLYPKVKKSVDPKYPDAAKRAKITGVVSLKAVVEPDGHVDRVSVIKSLDTKYGLDAEAVKAAKQWLFEPATKDGKPVAVWIDLELEFRLTAR
jgi:protein TonB